ncbi:MAG TPA: hypothetical protein EYN06_04830, partial [Myxococcales bacterium]|nr:hypothetical protein [Myxococcales bacterium]
MTAPTPEPQSRPFRLRYLFYAAAFVFFFFLILDGVIVFLERKGSVDTQNSNDPAWLSTGNPWHADGNRYVVGPADKKSMASMTFKVEKGAA